MVKQKNAFLSLIKKSTFLNQLIAKHLENNLSNSDFSGKSRKMSTNPKSPPNNRYIKTLITKGS